MQRRSMMLAGLSVAALLAPGNSGAQERLSPVAVTYTPTISFGMIGLGPQAGGGVAFMAHIGGFIAGVVLVKLFAVGSQPPLRRRSAW